MILRPKFAGPSVAAAGVAFFILVGLWPTAARTEEQATAADGGSAGAPESIQDSTDTEDPEEVADGTAVETAPVFAVPDRLKEPPLASAKPLPLDSDLVRSSRRESGHLVLKQGEEQRI